MRGFLSLEPDDATQARLVAVQNRLHDALNRQGVHFPDRLGPTLLSWPFATLGELDGARELLHAELPAVQLEGLYGLPNDDRPAEVGFAVSGVESLQFELFARLRSLLDPDPPKPPFIRLTRVSPPSRKVGAALRASGLLGHGGGPFVPRALTLWRQTPQGFEVHR